MGWSCTRAAHDAMERLTEQCVRATATRNRFASGGRSFFWEYDPVSHADGRITGTWAEEVGFEHCVGRGTFAILPDGTMSGGHPWMRLMCR